MSAHAIEILVRDWFDCWNDHDVDGLARFVAPDYVHHMMGGKDGGLDAFQYGFAAVVAAFPDIAYSITHVINDGQLVAAHLSGTGHHEGAFLGIPPTGELATFRGAYHCRVSERIIAEDWDVFDLLTPVLGLGGRVVYDA
jgi:predicted ester cyclase